MFPLLIDPTAQETQLSLREGEAEPEFSSSLPPRLIRRTFLELSKDEVRSAAVLPHRNLWSSETVTLGC